MDDRMRYLKLKRLWRKISSSNALLLVLCIISLWLVLLEPCLMGLRSYCQHDKVYVGNEKGNKHIPFHLYQEKPAESCPLFSLNYGSNAFYHIKHENVLCLRTAPYPDSCGIAQKLFFSKPTASCSYQSEHLFCNLEKSRFSSWTVKCNATNATTCASSLSLGLPNLESGNLEWETYSNTQALADKLTGLLRKPDVKHYGFAFIKCSDQETTQVTENGMNTHLYYDYYSNYLNENKPVYKEQLLILPPSVNVKKPPRDKNRSSSDINVNIILVDSTSRQHFFRSLKKTVSVLESITTDSNAAAYVFDFELMQALKSRTFETLQAIFSGYVNITETPFPTHGIPTKPLNLAPVFKSFQKKAYKTLWLEDLCYLWEWGISKDLHFLNLSRDPSDTWKLMWKRLQDNGVDDIDVTISMCKLLAANNMKDPFRSTESVCFNRKHQHEYLFEYLKYYQSEMLSVNQPFLSVTSTNVGHEETGQRIRTLDKDLADYISFVSSLDNTFSIILSDHGNAYGQFFSYSQEARVELFHPFLFFIIPKRVASSFNPAILSALQVNTKRLVTALDVHYTLLFLANELLKDIIANKQFPVSKKGLFEPVDSSRTCDSVPRIPPNLCICNSQDKPVKSSSFQALFGYHAVGAINAEIQRQFMADVPDITFEDQATGRCQALKLHEVSNIRENRDSNGIWKISMDIHVQESQVFFVALIVKPLNGYHHVVSLETVTRITKYGPYEQCADPTVELSLCICNISSSRQKLSLHSRLLQNDPYAKIPVIPYFKNSIDYVYGSYKCLLTFSAIHKQGKAVFVVNVCEKSYLFNLEVQAAKKDIYFSHSSKVLLLPGSLVYFALIINENQEGLSYPLRSHFQEVKNGKDYLPLLPK